MKKRLGTLIAAALIGLLASRGPAIGQNDDRTLEWPRELAFEDGSELVAYQPQIESWEDYERIEARMALAYRSAKGEEPILGAILLAAESEVDLDSHQVRISNFEITEGSFPAMDEPDSQAILARIRERFPSQMVVGLERLVAGLERGQSSDRSVELRVEPPIIHVSLEPAVLLQFDGEPILSPIEDNELKFSVNTNWDFFYFEKTKTYYLRLEDAWLQAPAVEGPWTAVKKLPKPFKRLPKGDDNWNDVRANIPGRKLASGEVPKVVVTEAPAELIVIYGRPSLEAIEGTELLWVTNTDSDLFLYAPEGYFYYLVSGRWFKADELDGPWSFATPELPSDFTRIPDDHQRGRVLVSVPGTADAQEALILAHIPQKATVERDAIEAPEVFYSDDEPQWKPIEGTSLAYASNTPFDVLRVGERYYLCVDAVWFESDSATGPWQVAQEVPDEIYTIPASSPVHTTTYVVVYDYTPSTVTFGYTSGYWGVYVGWGVPIYGSGWYWSPYYYWPPYYRYPFYYGYPYSYGTAAWYNPNTGTYGRGAAVYGPYGGIGRGAVYNPRSGTYARGGAAWGPYNATRAAGPRPTIRAPGRVRSRARAPTSTRAGGPPRSGGVTTGFAPPATATTAAR